MRRGVTWACLLGSAHALGAVTEADFLDEIPVVLSPSHLLQPLADSPSSVTVIDRDMIRASGFSQVADVFRLVPGFSVAYADNLTPTMTYHGLGDGAGRRFQVLIDGRSIYSSDFGQVFWRNLPLALEDIERIEVIRGPGGASYGANAFMGVINIMTRSGDLGAPYVEAGLGDHGQRVLNARVSGESQMFKWRLSSGTRLDNGLQDRQDQDILDDVRERYVDWKSELQLPDARQILTLQAGLAHGRQESDSTPINQHNGYASLGWQFAKSADSEFSVAYNFTRDDLSDDPGIDLGYRAARHNLNAQWRGRVNEVLRASLGVEARRDSAQSDFYFSMPDTITEDSWRVYGNGEWRLASQWLVNFGGMGEQAHTGENYFSPRLTLNYKPNREQAFRLEYNRAYRVQTFYELLAQNLAVLPDGTYEPPNGTTEIYQTLMADNLKSEQVTSRALGWLLQLPQHGLQLDARLFVDRYEDLIDVAFVSNGDGNDFIYQFQNLSDPVSLHGVEFQIEWRPSGSTRILFTPAWARIDSSDRTIESSAPPFSFSLLLDQKISAGWRASAGYYHSGAMTWLGAGGRVAASDRLDARLAYRTRAQGHPLEFWLTGQSLLGGQEEFDPGQKAQRRLLLGARAEW